MDSIETRSFNSLVKQFLGTRLPDRLARTVSFPELPPEAYDFTLRMLSLMQQAGYSPTDFTTILTRIHKEVNLQGVEIPSPASPIRLPLSDKVPEGATVLLA